jgi:hypothetical protein
VRLNEGQRCSNLADARKQQIDISLASATAWLFHGHAQTMLVDSPKYQMLSLRVCRGLRACTDPHLVGNLKSREKLRRVLPQKQITDASEIVKMTFKEVNPGPGKDYVYHPTIKTFL